MKNSFLKNLLILFGIFNFNHSIGQNNTNMPQNTNNTPSNLQVENKMFCFSTAINHNLKKDFAQAEDGEKKFEDFKKSEGYKEYMKNIATSHAFSSNFHHTANFNVDKDPDTLALTNYFKNCNNISLSLMLDKKKFSQIAQYFNNQWLTTYNAKAQEALEDPQNKQILSQSINMVQQNLLYGYMFDISRFVLSFLKEGSVINEELVVFIFALASEGLKINKQLIALGRFDEVINGLENYFIDSSLLITDTIINNKEYFITSYLVEFVNMISAIVKEDNSQIFKFNLAKNLSVKNDIFNMQDNKINKNYNYIIANFINALNAYKENGDCSFNNYNMQPLELYFIYKYNNNKTQQEIEKQILEKSHKFTSPDSITNFFIRLNMFGITMMQREKKLFNNIPENHIIDYCNEKIQSHSYVQNYLKDTEDLCHKYKNDLKFTSHIKKYMEIQGDLNKITTETEQKEIKDSLEELKSMQEKFTLTGNLAVEKKIGYYLIYNLLSHSETFLISKNSDPRAEKKNIYFMNLFVKDIFKFTIPEIFTEITVTLHKNELNKIITLMRDFFKNQKLDSNLKNIDTLALRIAKVLHNCLYSKLIENPKNIISSLENIPAA